MCNYNYIIISGGPLSALTCCVNVRLLSAIKQISPLIYSQSWVGSWVYTTILEMCAIEVFVWKRVCCRTGSGALTCSYISVIFGHTDKSSLIHLSNL